MLPRYHPFCFTSRPIFTWQNMRKQRVLSLEQADMILIDKFSEDEVILAFSSNPFMQELWVKSQGKKETAIKIDGEVYEFVSQIVEVV